MTTDPHPTDTDSPAGLLATVRADRRAADAAEARIVVAATTWVHTHPATCEADAAWPPRALRADGTPDPTADPGFDLPAPTWDAVPDFAAALGLKTGQGQDLVLAAMELRHRLPKVTPR